MNNNTFIPGLQDFYTSPGPTPVAPTSITEVPASTNNEISGAPVLGFLYSISRHGITEFWPLHAGSNTIGRNASNDIVLLEETISANHAVINTRRMRNGKVIAQIQDVGSKTGIFVNEEELSYTAVECNNNDVIVFGASYKCLLLLINMSEFGLEPAKDFRDVQRPQELGSTTIPDIPKTVTGIQIGGTGTMAIDPTAEPTIGGTCFMDDK